MDESNKIVLQSLYYTILDKANCHGYETSKFSTCVLLVHGIQGRVL